MEVKNGYNKDTEHRMTSLEAKVNLILTNHLPHLEKKVDYVLNKVDKLEWVIYVTFAIAVATQIILKIFI